MCLVIVVADESVMRVLRTSIPPASFSCAPAPRLSLKAEYGAMQITRRSCYVPGTILSPLSVVDPTCQSCLQRLGSILAMPRLPNGTIPS